jgi:hypothetical protein
VLVRAIETRDVDTVTRHVYFGAVRKSLTNQIIAAYVRRTGIQISPLAQSMAASALGITDPVVAKLISPEALSELLSVGWPVTVVPDPPPGTVGITSNTIGTIWQAVGPCRMALRYRQPLPSGSKIGHSCRMPSSKSGQSRYLSQRRVLRSHSRPLGRGRRYFLRDAARRRASGYSQNR